MKCTGILDCCICVILQPRAGEPPLVRWYLEGERTLKINKNFLARSTTSTAFHDLKTPPDYPTPAFRTVVREWNLDVSFYGGNDFEIPQCVRWSEKSKHGT